METPATPNKITLQWEVAQRNWLWFEKYDPFDPEVINSNIEPDQLQLTFSSNFDYEMLPKKKPRVYIDIGLKALPLASIYFRVRFEGESCDLYWSNYFQPEVIEPCVKAAVDECVRAFKEQCIANEINLTAEIKPGPITVQNITNAICDAYHNHRRGMDKDNRKVINSPGLEVTPGRKTQIPLKITFMILDDVLFNNRNFNRRENLENFTEVVPVPLYHTVKMKCMEIDKGEIKLSLYHTAFFLVCLDCALQLMLGDHEQELLTSLNGTGLSIASRDIFIEEGSILLRDFKKQTKSAGVHITFLDKRYDWNALIS
jgi:hypothetical protein